MMLLGKILFCCEKQAVVTNKIVLPLHIDLDETKKELTLKRRSLQLNVRVKRKNT